MKNMVNINDWRVGEALHYPLCENASYNSFVALTIADTVLLLFIVYDMTMTYCYNVYKLQLFQNIFCALMEIQDL